MTTLVTISVSNVESALLSYDSIKVYRSDYQDGIFSEISDMSTRPVLVSTSKYYVFVDESGHSSHWYKTSYYNSITTAESSKSSAVQGVEKEEEFYDTTYPVEISINSSDMFDINRIRLFAGDEKKVYRAYVSPACTDGYENVSADGYTYELYYRGWPLKVIRDLQEYTTVSGARVTDYKYITFEDPISTTSGVLDIWCESFRHSDREILKVLNAESDPPYVSASDVTAEMMQISAAITILEQEIAQLMGETSGSFNLQGELSYNPDPILRNKREHIASLKKKLDDLVDKVVSVSITGVRID